VHRFDWRKKHAQVINESTSHLFFSFQKRISSRIPSTDDGRWHREKVSQVASWGRVVRVRATRIRKKKNAGEENDDDDAREDKEEHNEYYKYY
jgi:hypothetical protein